MAKITIALPQAVKEILNTLENNGYEGYAVGGGVRDSLLGRVPRDWDIATSATPEQVKGIFPHTADTGLKHGTVTVILDDCSYEVTTFRLDGAYLDNRHPDTVVFTDDLLVDLGRRDFTINAMAYNDKKGLVDIFGGQADLQRGVIRCVGCAEKRFTEDALRMLRGVRFGAELGFDLDDDLKTAVKAKSVLLANISAERIRGELVRLLVSPHPEYVKILWELGLTAVILPEFDVMMATPQNNPHHCYSVGGHTLKALGNIEDDKCLRLTMLLHDVGKPEARSTDSKGVDHFRGHGEIGTRIAVDILHRLKMDSYTIAKVEKYIRYHDVRPEPTLKSVRRAVSRLGIADFGELLKIKRADMLGQNPAFLEGKLDYLAKLTALYEEIIAEEQCLSLDDLAIDGSDLIADGMTEGREVGYVLRGLLDYVLENPHCNQRDKLLAYSHILREKLC